jgi:hypothetical protein
MELVTHIYAVYCKDESGITILKKAYKSKAQAYRYVITKIKTLLNIINEDYKQNSENHILPVGAQVVYTIFNMKEGNDIEQYEYFKENHIKFFQHVAKKPVMFYVSTLELI